MVSAAYTTQLHLRLQMMQDAASAIAFLHSKGIMHCDIKSLNFLVDEVSSIELILCRLQDFELIIVLSSA